MYHQFIRIECINCGNVFDVPVYCGDRFCPICSCIRRSRIRKRLNFLVENIDPPSPYCIKHLTLTIKNQSDLAHMFTVILKSFRKLRNTSSWKRHVNGGAFVAEITGEPNNWHLHLHIIIESRYYKWAELLALWRKVSPGRGVYIQNIPKSQIVRYLTKYLTKNETPPDANEELNDALKGSRLFQPFGSWYAINLKYVKPPKICSSCGNACYMLYGEYSEMTDIIFWKEVEIKPP